MNQPITSKLNEQIASTIEGLGCQYAGSEWIGSGVPVWRIYVEGKNNSSITIAEITQITKQLNALLDVEMPRASQYRLEISSPGLDRRLFTVTDYRRFLGHEVKIRLHAPVEERRNWQGQIIEVQPETLTLKVENNHYTFSLNNIDKANLVPNLK